MLRLPLPTAALSVMSSDAVAVAVNRYQSAGSTPPGAADEPVEAAFGGDLLSQSLVIGGIAGAITAIRLGGGIEVD